MSVIFHVLLFLQEFGCTTEVKANASVKLVFLALIMARYDSLGGSTLSIAHEAQLNPGVAPKRFPGFSPPPLAAILEQTNSQFFSALAPARAHTYPNITVQMPVYKEGLEAVILPSIISLEVREPV